MKYPKLNSRSNVEGRGYRGTAKRIVAKVKSILFSFLLSGVVDDAAYSTAEFSLLITSYYATVYPLNTILSMIALQHYSMIAFTVFIAFILK